MIMMCSGDTIFFFRDSGNGELGVSFHRLATDESEAKMEGSPWPQGKSLASQDSGGGDMTSPETPDSTPGPGDSGKRRKKRERRKKRVTWQQAGDLAKKAVVERKVRKNRALLWLVLLLVLPVSLALLANHYKHKLPLDFLYGRDPPLSHASPHGQAVREQTTQLGLHGESSASDGSSLDVLRMLVPDVFAESFQRVYRDKLAGDVRRLYNKTVEFDVVPFDKWKTTTQEDMKKRSMGRYHVYSILATWIPTFAEQNSIKDLTGLLSNLDSSYWEDVMPQVRENVATYNNKIFALPVDADVFFMMYNSRILGEHNLRPPETWHEWIEVAKKLHGKDLNGDGEPDVGACVVTLKNGYSASYFFAFAAPFIQTYGTDEGIFFDPNTMSPKFAAPEYSAILDLYKVVVDHSTHSVIGETSWQEASDLFLKEKCALTFNFHGALKPILTSLKTKEDAEKFRLKMMPGTKVVLSVDGKSLEECDEHRCPFADENQINRAPFYGEGGVAIAFNPHMTPENLEAATSFAISLTGPEDSLPLLTKAGNLLDPYRYSHFKNLGDLESEESKVYGADGWYHQTLLNWQKDYMSAFEHPNGVKDLAVYGKVQYTGESALESVLIDLFEGKENAEESRARLEKAWSILTSRYGNHIQQNMYRKSLGLPTSSLEVPVVILGVVLVSVGTVAFLAFKNRQLSHSLSKEMKNSRTISKWTKLVEDNPASRLMNVLALVREGKQVDTKLVDALMISLMKKSGDFWSPDWNNNEFAKVKENNEDFANYLQFNLMSNFIDNLGTSGRSNSSRGSKKFSRTITDSPKSEQNLRDILKSASVKMKVTASKDIRKHYKVNDKVFSKSLNDIDRCTSSGNPGIHFIQSSEVRTLEDIGCWNIDIFGVSEVSNGHPILTVVHNIFKQDLEVGEFTTSTLLRDLEVNEEKFFRYVQVIESQMHPENVYHNAVHVADVVHNMLWLLTKGEMAARLGLSKFEVFTSLFACMIHDFDHPGVSNDFLVRTSDKRAVLYNNQSVNENWHVAQAFGLLNECHEEISWDESWTEDCLFKFRKLCVSMVLATDMSRHFELLGKFRNRVVSSPNAEEAFNPLDAKDRETVLVMAIKACDIATQGKEWKLARKWAMLVQEEFYSQGDKEKDLGLTVSPLCDRENVDIVKSQIGFIDAVLFPLYEPLSKVLPNAKCVLTQLERSKSMYKKEMAARSSSQKSLKSSSI